MKLLSTLTTFIAKTGESPTFVAYNAHCWFAFACITVIGNYIHAIPAAILAIGLACAKEFWFDLKYETTPPQTLKDSTEDFIGYAAGIGLAVLWSLAH